MRSAAHEFRLTQGSESFAIEIKTVMEFLNNQWGLGTE